MALILIIVAIGGILVLALSNSLSKIFYGSKDDDDNEEIRKIELSSSGSNLLEVVKSASESAR